jgi:hypothetical protein
MASLLYATLYLAMQTTCCRHKPYCLTYGYSVTSDKNSTWLSRHCMQNHAEYMSDMFALG